MWVQGGHDHSTANIEEEIPLDSSFDYHHWPQLKHYLLFYLSSVEIFIMEDPQLGRA